MYFLWWCTAAPSPSLVPAILLSECGTVVYDSCTERGSAVSAHPLLSYYTPSQYDSPPLFLTCAQKLCSFRILLLLPTDLLLLLLKLRRGSDAGWGGRALKKIPLLGGAPPSIAHMYVCGAVRCLFIFFFFWKGDGCKREVIKKLWNEGMLDVDVSRKRKNYFVAYQYLWSNYFFSRLSSSVRIFFPFFAHLPLNGSLFSLSFLIFSAAPTDSLFPFSFPLLISSPFFPPIQIPSLIHPVHLLHIFPFPPIAEKRALNLFRAGNEQMLCWGNPEICCWCFRCVITECESHITNTKRAACKIS